MALEKLRSGIPYGLGGNKIQLGHLEAKLVECGPTALPLVKLLILKLEYLSALGRVIANSKPLFPQQGPIYPCAADLPRKGEDTGDDRPCFIAPPLLKMCAAGEPGSDDDIEERDSGRREGCYRGQIHARQSGPASRLAGAYRQCGRFPSDPASDERPGRIG
jgi:hypothetical protein